MDSSSLNEFSCKALSLPFNRKSRWYTNFHEPPNRVSHLTGSCDLFLTMNQTLQNKVLSIQSIRLHQRARGFQVYIYIYTCILHIYIYMCIMRYVYIYIHTTKIPYRSHINIICNIYMYYVYSNYLYITTGFIYSTVYINQLLPP